MLDPVANKYETKCTIRESGDLVFERIYEAINEQEAEARAYLNCVNENNKKTNIHVEVKRI